MQISCVIGLYRILVHKLPVPQLIIPVNSWSSHKLVKVMVTDLLGSRTNLSSSFGASLKNRQIRNHAIPQLSAGVGCAFL